MEYASIKNKIALVMGKNVLMRKLFYMITGIVFLREWYVKRIIKDIFRNNQSVKEILDAGSGFGQYCYYCRKKFPQANILGIDINQDYIDNCNRFMEQAGLQKIVFRREDLTAIDYKNRFDLILSVDVLEHIKKDTKLLSLFAKAVVPDGFVIISTPTVYRKHHEDGMFVDEHERPGYSEQDITEKLKNSGFSHIDINYSYGTWGDLSWRLGVRNFMKIAQTGLAGKVFAPLYFMVIFPLMFILMLLDYFWNNKTGTGFVVVARK